MEGKGRFQGQGKARQVLVLQDKATQVLERERKVMSNLNK